MFCVTVALVPEVVVSAKVTLSSSATSVMLWVSAVVPLVNPVMPSPT